MDERMREWAVLSHCALRFDGYRYAAAHRFTFAAAIDDFYNTGAWHITPIEQLATFALMLHSFRWGGDGGAADGQYWRAFRDLFLTVHAYAIPDDYRTAWTKVWERDYLPHLDEHVALVQRIHDSTHYNDTSGRGGYALVESPDDIEITLVETDERNAKGDV